MNIQELPDRDLDNLFRKAVDSVDYPFQESAWQDMEGKLNGWERFSNIFWKRGETWHTPAPACGGVEGVMQGFILEQ